MRGRFIIFQSKTLTRSCIIRLIKKVRKRFNITLCALILKQTQPLVLLIFQPHYNYIHHFQQQLYIILECPFIFLCFLSSIFFIKNSIQHRRSLFKNEKNLDKSKFEIDCLLTSNLNLHLVEKECCDDVIISYKVNILKQIKQRNKQIKIYILFFHISIAMSLYHKSNDFAV